MLTSSNHDRRKCCCGYCWALLINRIYYWFVPNVLLSLLFFAFGIIKRFRRSPVLCCSFRWKYRLSKPVVLSIVEVNSFFLATSCFFFRFDGLSFGGLSIWEPAWMIWFGYPMWFDESCATIHYMNLVKFSTQIALKSFYWWSALQYQRSMQYIYFWMTAQNGSHWSHSVQAGPLQVRHCV